MVEDGRGTDIATADAGEFDLDDDIVSVFELGDGAVFELDFVDFLEDEGWVLESFLLALKFELEALMELWWG
jgi:hypothetical protein